MLAGAMGELGICKRTALNNQAHGMCYNHGACVGLLHLLMKGPTNGNLYMNALELCNRTTLKLM